MRDSDTDSRSHTGRTAPDCRAQLLVYPPLQLYLVARILALSTGVALVTALCYVGVEGYVAGRWPTTFSLVPLLIAVVVTTPLVVWFALVMSQRVMAPLVRLVAWTRHTAPAAAAESELLQLRTGDPSAELVAALQQAIVERIATRHDEHSGPPENSDVAAASATSTAV